MNGPVLGHWRWLLAAAVLACNAGDAERSAPAAGGAEAANGRPNLLWVVWDTVRADRMSLYGHERSTTPRLDAWARGALVFEDAVSPAGYTIPAHASMFTGLLPSEHCAHNDHPHLADEFETLAELLRSRGWATWLFSANPNVSATRNLAQGFDRVEHPWSERHAEEARGVLRSKLVPGDTSHELADRVSADERGEGALGAWNLKAAGRIARGALLEFLESLDDDSEARPWFAFVNYMEAHRPYIPPREYREKLMEPDEVERSYRVDRRWSSLWEYNFRQREYDEDEIALTRATYDAALLELDDLFADLLAALEREGRLENTVVVLTSDHGEQLGEQHMLDHQQTLYEPALRVPLVLWAPGRVAPGRSSAAATTLDLFPTLLALLGVDAGAPSSQAIDLLAASERDTRARVRLSEDPAETGAGVRAMQKMHPGWDPKPWIRSQRSLRGPRYKYIWSSNGRRELYDLPADPGELHDLANLRQLSANEMRAALERVDATLRTCVPGSGPAVELPPQERELLETLGYLDGSEGSGESAASSGGSDSPESSR